MLSHLFFLYLYLPCFFFFFFNDTATTEIYTLSLHDALPILREAVAEFFGRDPLINLNPDEVVAQGDRKSTRLNSSHSQISYAVFCLKKKKKKKQYFYIKNNNSKNDAE